MSDSHDNIVAIRDAVRFFNDSGCNLVIHAGDFIAPFAAKELEGLGCPLKAVFGNCDGEKKGLEKAIQPFGLIKKAPLSFEYERLVFLVSHLNSPPDTYLARQKYDVFIFGHTHKPEIRQEKNTLLINPGETGGWLTGKNTVALFDPISREAEIINL